MPIGKSRSRRIRSEIRRILLEHWDPVGIKDVPHAQGEYDSYLGGVYDLLMRGATDKEISDHLWQIIEEKIEIHPKTGATEETVRELQCIPIPRQ